MDSNHKEYSYTASFQRIDNILATSQANYEEVKELPHRDRLTFTNGFYASCSAIFVDIRDSSSLPDHYKRPALARLYRAYISETVALVNSLQNAREINIVGDGVWAVINTPKKPDIDEVFSVSAKINSLVKVLNYKLEKAGYTADPLRVGIGMEYGRALMIKAGYSGSGINDVVYMGDVVNRAAKLAAKANKDGSPKQFIGNVFANNLNKENSELITKDYINDCWTASIRNNGMDKWYEDNCK